MDEQRTYTSPKSDPRSTQELISVALSQDEELSHQAIVALHFRGDRNVLEQTEKLCESNSSRDRTVGADILGQLGVPERTFPEDCFRILSSMLQSEQDADVLQSVAVAFGHLNDARAIPLMKPFVSHPDPDVRYGVVRGMSRHEDAIAIESLIKLSSDVDSDVRDWATFGLGQMITTDSSEIRDALVARLPDPDTDTRQEAIDGLAARGDERALQTLIPELEAEQITMLALEIAQTLANPRLIPLLEKIEAGWHKEDASDRHVQQLQAALSACRQNVPNRLKTEN